MHQDAKGKEFLKTCRILRSTTINSQGLWRDAADQWRCVGFAGEFVSFFSQPCRASHKISPNLVVCPSTLPTSRRLDKCSPSDAHSLLLDGILQYFSSFFFSPLTSRFVSKSLHRASACTASSVATGAGATSPTVEGMAHDGEGFGFQAACLFCPCFFSLRSISKFAFLSSLPAGANLDDELPLILEQPCSFGMSSWVSANSKCARRGCRRP